MHMKTARIYLHGTPAWSEDEQEALAREWCRKYNLHIALYRASNPGDRDLWVRNLGQADVGIMCRLDLLVPPKPGRRPSHDLALAIAKASKRAGLLVEAMTGITNQDEARWLEAYEKALHRVSTGRRYLTRRKAQAMARKSHVRRPKGILRKWTDDNPVMIEERAKWGAVWKSRKFDNWEQARDAMPDDLKAASRATLWRIFGSRGK